MIEYEDAENGSFRVEFAASVRCPACGRGARLEETGISVEGVMERVMLLCANCEHKAPWGAWDR